MERLKKYYIDLDLKSGLFEVIDCTDPVTQPVIKGFKYEKAAYNFLRKLRTSNTSKTKTK